MVYFLCPINFVIAVTAIITRINGQNTDSRENAIPNTTTTAAITISAIAQPGILFTFPALRSSSSL